MILGGADPEHRDRVSMENAFDIAQSDELRSLLVRRKCHDEKLEKIEKLEKLVKLIRMIEFILKYFLLLFYLSSLSSLSSLLLQLCYESFPINSTNNFFSEFLRARGTRI